MGWFDSLFADDAAERQKPRDPRGRLPSEPEFDAFRTAWKAGASLFDLFGDQQRDACGSDAQPRGGSYPKHRRGHARNIRYR